MKVNKVNREVVTTTVQEIATTVEVELTVEEYTFLMLILSNIGGDPDPSGLRSLSDSILNKLGYPPNEVCARLFGIHVGTMRFISGSRNDPKFTNVVEYYERNL